MSLWNRQWESYGLHGVCSMVSPSKELRAFTINEKLFMILAELVNPNLDFFRGVSIVSFIICIIAQNGDTTILPLRRYVAKMYTIPHSFTAITQTCSHATWSFVGCRRTNYVQTFRNCI